MKFSLCESYIDYDFDDREFEYEFDDNEFITYLHNKYSLEDLANMFQEELAEVPEWGDQDYDQEDVLDDTIANNIFKFEDQIKDYFQRDAYEEYIDQREYEKDPYSYNGVSRSDFI